MAKYLKYSDVKDSEEFKEYVQTHYGKKIEDIKDFEEGALLDSYKIHINDLDKSVDEILSENNELNRDDQVEKITAERFPDKKYADLSPEQQEAINKEADATLTKELDELASTNFGKKYEELSSEDKGYITSLKYNGERSGLTMEDIKNYLSASKADISNEEQSNGHVLTKKQIEELRDYYNGSRVFKDGETYENLTEDEKNHLIALGLEPKDNSNEPEVTDKHVLTKKQIEELRDYYNGSRVFKDGETYENLTEDEKNHLIALGLEPKDNSNEPENTEGTKESEKQDPITPLVVDVPDKDNDNQLTNEEYRVRSVNSDQNDYMLNIIKVQALLNMEVLKEKDLEGSSPVELTPEKADALIDKVWTGLDDKQVLEFNRQTRSAVLGSEALFATMPAGWLAEQYTSVKTEIEKEKDEEKRKILEEQKDIITKRIDNVTMMLGRGEKTDDDLYFADITNIADVHQGYMDMFEVRGKDLEQIAQNGQTEEEKSRASFLLEVQKEGKATLDSKMDEYLEEYDIKDVTPKDADRLNDRYDDITKKLEEVSLTEETAQLVSNFKFLDNEGKPEPQFIDENGNMSDVYASGFRVIKGSKLDMAIDRTKQQVLRQNLGGQTEVTPEYLEKEVNENLGATLHTIHTYDQVTKGILEHPNEFTDKKYLNKFIQDLGNTDRPMEISPAGYDRGLQALTNAEHGYNETLAKKIGKDKPVINKLAGKTFDRNQIRKEMLKRGGVAFGSAFLVSGTITLGATAAAGAIESADWGITAATGGANKLAGIIAAGASVGIGLGVAYYRYQKWKKAQKKEGKPTNFFKNYLADGKNRASVATTLLGVAAVGFAVTGNPRAALACGGTALAIAAGAGFKTARQDAHKGGLGVGKKEAVGWGMFMAAMSVAGGLAGRQVANMGIDAVNNHNPDDMTYQHKETYEHTTIKEKTEIVTDYEKMTAGAQKNLNLWYKGHEDLLQQRIDDINAYNQEHGTNIDPYRFLRNAHDAGAVAPDNMRLHVQGGPDIHSHGHHDLFTDSWRENNNISIDEVKALANSVTSDGHVKITPEAVDAYNKTDELVNDLNQAKYNKTDIETQNDGVLGYNLEKQNDTYVTTPKGKVFGSYGTGDNFLPTTEKTTFEVNTVKTEITVRNETPFLVGTMDYFIPKFKAARKRIGAFLDKIINKPKPVPETTVVIPAEEPKEKPKEEPKEKPEEKTLIVEPVDNSKNLLMEEYKIVYGIQPKEEDKPFQDYCKRVETERQQSDPEKPMEEFLQGRLEKLDNVVKDNIGSTHRTLLGEMTPEGVKTRVDYMSHANQGDRGGAAVIAEVRQSLQESNLSKSNYESAITLSHFTKYAPHAIAKDTVASDGSRNIELNPELKRKYSAKPNSDVTVTYMDLYLVGNKSLAASQEKVKGRDLAEVGRETARNNSRTPRPTLKRSGKDSM